MNGSKDRRVETAERCTPNNACARFLAKRQEVVDFCSSMLET